MFDHFQFALIHGRDIPGSYAILLFTTSDFTSITSHIHSWALFFFGSASSFFLELFPHSSPVAYWAPTDLGRRRQWYPTPVLLPGKSHGRRSLVGCSPWGRKESDITERLHFHFSLSYIGEGNGNPLQCSCLENPRDGGAWWAAVYGVAQSWTRLK